MYNVRLTPEDIKSKIEYHFKKLGYKTNITERIRIHSGRGVSSITYRGEFQKEKRQQINFNIPLTKREQPTVTNIGDSYRSSETNNLFTEIQMAIRV